MRMNGFAREREKKRKNRKADSTTEDGTRKQEKHPIVKKNEMRYKRFM